MRRGFSAQITSIFARALKRKRNAIAELFAAGG